MSKVESLPIPISWVDAFAHRPFAGNQAAICLLHKAVTTEWMQALAVEINLSETAFLLPQGDGSFGLRWFTPGGEIELCGHATLAAAHALWNDFSVLDTQNLPAELVFETLSGSLTAQQRSESEGQAGTASGITLNFPQVVPQAITQQVAPELIGRELTGDALTRFHSDINTALGLPSKTRILFTGKAGFKLFVELESEQAVLDCSPDFKAISDLPLRGVLVTAKSEQREYDFVSRFFVPEMGINEDPVTGSAHCTLAPYWAQKLGRQSLIGYQASKRGGVVEVEVLQHSQRVALTGQSHTIFTGVLNEQL